MSCRGNGMIIDSILNIFLNLDLSYERDVRGRNGATIVINTNTNNQATFNQW